MTNELREALAHVMKAAHFLEDAAFEYEAAHSRGAKPELIRRAQTALDRARETNSDARFLARSLLRRTAAVCADCEEPESHAMHSVVTGTPEDRDNHPFRAGDGERTAAP